MVRRTLLLVACTLASVVLISPASGQGKREPLVEKVKTGIDRGIGYLRQARLNDGSWEVNISTVGFKGGGTSLVLLALLNAGVPTDDPDVKAALAWLRALQPDKTYVRALQTMVFVEAGQREDLLRIKDNIDWLIKARVLDGNKLKGWSYSLGPALNTDNSNTQYALLGLWAGRQAGIDINREIWEAIRDFYIRTQNDEGGWAYSSGGGPLGAGSSMTMTTAGLCGLLIAGMELNSGREVIQGDGSAKNCGAYDENAPIAKAMGWIAGARPDRFTLDLQQRTFYHLYGLERAGRLTGLRFFGSHDWYREGSEFLVRVQRADGSWSGPGHWDQWPVISTSFALLFLSKGRTPVLVSKLVHGPWPRNDADTDWNNDRNDLRHLVDFVHKSEMFKKIPLAWQTIDIMHALAGQVGEDVLSELTSDMLQSPIVYFNGHRSPAQRFTGMEKEMLKRYVENGGFIVVEACCNSADFDRGFKALAADLWPDNPLDWLPAEHPVWTSFYKIKPGDPYKLMGISLGCKTVLIYSPQDLSCRWEGNDTKNAQGERAFKLGANLVAYATGLEPPRPRLTRVQVASTKEDPAFIPRGYLKVGQLKYGEAWPAPRAMRNLMDYLRTQAGIDVVLKTEELSINSAKIMDFKFIYMHGRQDFTFAPAELKNLRFNLENGGLLFADACCGKETFDKAFRQFAQNLFPKEKLEQVPQDDMLFSKDLNGESLTEQNIQCRREKGGPMRGVPPYLEGVKVNGRWVVLYSKYDIGCALERHKSSDCLGYHPDSALRIAGAAVLYMLRP